MAGLAGPLDQTRDVSPPGADDPGAGDQASPTPEIYARRVEAYSQQRKESSLFPGSNYQYLADFLMRPYSRTLLPPKYSLEPDCQFVTLHKFEPGYKHEVRRFDSGLRGLAELGTEGGPSAGSGHLLFLGGYSSPEWLNLIGARYRVDPEFYRRHLDFMQPKDQFDLPSLLSASKNIVKLPLVTIGVQRNLGSLGIDSLQQHREKASEETQAYLQQMDKTAEIGQSIVRNFLIHDENYFTIEQEVSICVESRKGGWTGIIWLDSGQDLSQTRTGPWLNEPGIDHISSKFSLPVYQHKPKIALYGQGTPQDHVDHKENGTFVSNTYQSASSLPKYYGQTLNHDVLRIDAFYALTEIFTFAAFSESQYLNLIERVIQREERVRPEHRQYALANLQYAKATLETHIQKICGIISCIKTRGPPEWPRAAPNSNLIFAADHAAYALSEDYEHLAERAKSLSKRCSDKTALLMNMAMLSESQQGLLQAQAATRLTLLAFFFLPVSFTSSFFGMNFTEISGANGPRWSIWIWFASSGVVFIFSLGVCFWSSIYPYLKQFITQKKTA